MHLVKIQIALEVSTTLSETSQIIHLVVILIIRTSFLVKIQEILQIIIRTKCKEQPTLLFLDQIQTITLTIRWIAL